MNKEQNHDNLEHNDGLGDLLQERETLQFSWQKTIGVIAGLLSIILVSIFFIFNVSKKHLSNNISLDTTYSTQEDIIADYDFEELTDHEIVNQDTSKIASYDEPTSQAPKQSIKTNEVFSFRIITGTYKNKQNANQQVAKLKNSGFDSFIRKKEQQSSFLYQVQAGAFKDKKSALAFKQKLTNKKFDSYIIETKI